MKQVASLLAGLLEANPRTLILDTDALSSYWAEDLRESAPYRIFDTGAGGRSHIGVAAGLAGTGEFIPVMTGAADRLLSDGLGSFADMIAKPGLNVKAVAFMEEADWLAGRWQGSELAALGDIGGVSVLEPCDADDARRLLAAACEQPGPAYLAVVPHSAQAKAELPPAVAWGKAESLRDGDEVTILATGPSTLAAMIAAEELARDSIPCRVAHAPCVCPFDTEFALDAARKTLGIVVAEPCAGRGGLREAVANAVAGEYSCLIRAAALARGEPVACADDWVAKLAQAISREARHILDNA